jgi:hypothetical protein
MIPLILAAIGAPIPVGGGAGANVWGGQGAILEVTDAGAEIEFDCAHGRIDGPVPLGANGRFDLPGSFTPQHAGPSRDGDPHASGVRYVGVVEGDQLTLTVRKGEETLGAFVLRRGTRPPLRKCR